MSQISDINAIAAAVRAALTQVLGTADQFIPLHVPEFRGNEWSYVKECLDTGWVSSVGAYVDRFESDMAAFVGAKHAVAVVNGTAALHLALLLAGVKPGEEVIAPALSFVATANAIAYCHAVPHFADISPTTLGMDPNRLSSHLHKVTEMRNGRLFNRQTGRRIAGVVPMHTFGHPVDIAGMLHVCEEFDLPMVEDAAESLGSTYGGRHCGTFGLLGTMSFNGNKVVTTGGGGMIVTNDLGLAKRAKHLSTTAKLGHPWFYVHDAVGFNYRLPNINAALGCAQLENLPTALMRKRQLAEAYSEAFAQMPGVSFVRESQGTCANYWLNAILVDECANSVEVRDRLLEELNAANYMVRPAWALLHTLAPFLDAPRMHDLSVSESIERRLVNLPSSAQLGRHLSNGF
jgi:perosamine synthetase